MHRVTAFLDRPEHVAAQHKSVVHRDRHVPIDPHAVADFADLTIAHASSPKIRLQHWGIVSSSGGFHFFGNNRQQDIGLPVRAGVQRHFAAEHRRRPIARIVVREYRAAGPHFAQRFEAFAGLAREHVIVAAHRQRQPIALRQRDAGRPDFDVDLVDLAGGELLLFVVGVIGPVRQRQLRVELAMRATQPALRDRRVRIERALEGDFLEVGRKRAHHQKQIGVFGRRRHPQLGRDRAGDLGILIERLSQESHAVAEAGIGDRRFPTFGGAADIVMSTGWMYCLVHCVRASGHSFSCRSTNFSPGCRTCSCTFGCSRPAGLVAFEEAAKEPLLQVETVVRIEVCPVLDAVHFEPFVLRRGAHEAFEIAARMQALPAPVGCGEQRHLDFVPVWHARLPIFVSVELARQTILVKVAAILAEFLFRDKVSGPDTQSPVMRLLKPRVPRPFCSV